MLELGAVIGGCNDLEVIEPKSQWLAVQMDPLDIRLLRGNDGLEYAIQGLDGFGFYFNERYFEESAKWVCVGHIKNEPTLYQRNWLRLTVSEESLKAVKLFAFTVHVISLLVIIVSPEYAASWKICLK